MGARAATLREVSRRILIIFVLLTCGAAFGREDTAASANSAAYHDSSADGALLNARGEPPVRAQVVIGTDQRVPIADTSVFPFSAIAFLELEDEFGEVFGSCTGTFIGPDALLTAGHCLWDADFGTWGAAHVRVVPGKDGPFEPFGSQYASDWWVPDAYAETGDPSWDWGVIKLPNDLLSLDTSWMSVAMADTATLEDPEFFPAIVGYPGDKADGSMWGHIQAAFVTVADFRLYYDIDTAAGQSGSAIWSAADGPYLGVIVGIHTQGGTLNSGQRIDQELLDDLLLGCAAMECVISVVDLSAGPVPVPGPTPPPPTSLPFRSYGVALARD